MHFLVPSNIRNKIISTIFQTSSKPEHLTALWHFLSHYQTSKYHRYSVKPYFLVFYVCILVYFIYLIFYYKRPTACKQLSGKSRQSKRDIPEEKKNDDLCSLQQDRRWDLSVWWFLFLYVRVALKSN